MCTNVAFICCVDHLKIRTKQFLLFFNIIGCTIDQVVGECLHSGSLVDVSIFNGTADAKFSSREKQRAITNSSLTTTMYVHSFANSTTDHWNVVLDA